jgi:hypothetical protein
VPAEAWAAITGVPPSSRASGRSGLECGLAPARWIRAGWVWIGVAAAATPVGTAVRSTEANAPADVHHALVDIPFDVTVKPL